jgi:ABC-type multidrug transport system fused ATPase/permease subunit
MLLSASEQKQYVWRVLSGLAIALLDIFGIILVGLISFDSSKGSNAQIEKLKNLFNLDLGNINFMVLAVSLFFLVKSLASVFMIRSTNRFLTTIAVKNSSELATSIFSRNISNIQQHSSQQYAYSLGIGMNSIFLEILGGFLIIFVEIFLLAVLLLVLALFNLAITLIVIAYFGLVVFLMQVTLSKISLRSGKMRVRSEVASTQIIQESIFSFRELYVSGAINSALEKYKLVRKDAGHAYADSQWVGILPKYTLETFLLFGAAMIYSSTKLLSDNSNPSLFIPLYLIAGLRMLPSMLRIQAALGNVKGGTGNSIHTFELLSDSRLSFEKSYVQGLSGDVSDQFVPSVVLKSVSFIYPSTNQNAISDINLTIANGSHLALVGPSGAGKSTLVDLILGVHKSDTGLITISGIEPRDAIYRWPNEIRYVPQTVGLFDCSVAENIALRKLRSEEEELLVIRALEFANLQEIIVRSNGIHSNIGERGLRLSGGQRQRLGIARAMFSNPKLLILDEATSALDADTEETITQLIKGLHGETTVITIAHRLSTIRLADQIAYMDGGRILATGTFDQLRKNLPEFDRQSRLMGLTN